MLRLLCFFFTLMHLGWSANEYLFENNNRGIISTHQTHNALNIPQQGNQYYEQPAAPVNYEKEVFYFSAPEEEQNQARALQKLTSSVKRRQQVIFIKSPENNAYEKAVENLVRNYEQQKTHIYVLNKEPDYAGLRQTFQTIQKNIQHKPELNFISYRNPSDAERIQSSIVQQYGGGIVKPLFANNKVVRTQSVLGHSLPVSRSYAKNVDFVPANTYIPVV